MAQLAVTGDHKKGWTLRSGGFANLCDKCGTAYEQVAFCELYHLDDTGWRECTSCGKRLHCGCIASSAFLELLDNGGVNCVSCSNPKTRETRSSSVDNHVNLGNFNEKILTKLDDEAIDNGKKLLLPSVNNDVSRCRMTQEENGTSESVHAGRFKDVCGSVVQTNLNKTYSYFHQGHWPRYIFPKSILSQRFNGNGGMMSSQLRVARPPVEGYVKNQLLPRYWPRITEQELQQISGDSNATIVPLFEKVLSASDVGRIGRLVLPKACAEAYFPAISQPEGLPLKIKDVKGTEWLFQFRFWPNNNSRMYVLEGVTPCIQSMQLQAGDTVTFSRMEPEGKLLMGFRKASTSTSVQLQKGNTYSHLNELSRNLILANGNVGWHTNEQFGMGGSFPEKKRSRNIGSKSKRLLIESQDALELKHTWEESQDMLFPAPLLKPTIVTIDNNELEEYEEPPVFGKGSIFTVCSSGEQEQWGQCDNCSKWRKLPADFILPPRWTCQENVWDQSRAVCLAPNELSLRELDNLLRLAKDFENMKHCVSHKTEEDDMGIESSSVAMTTKHPRHRPGCSCIVCIQPPSGKGKHKSTCSCNVCMTVKRRFKTLMLRKKKRQLEEHESRIGKEKGDLELNRVSMMSLVQVANLPLETYLKQNGLTSLISSSGETGETLGGDEEDDCRELQGPDGNIQEACL